MLRSAKIFVKSITSTTMPPKRDGFSFEIESRLIQEIEQRPLLWDTGILEYRQKPLKDRAWEEIAQILGPAFSGTSVQARFKGMRKTFMENLARETEAKKRCSGNGAGETYKSKWPLYELLSFLKKTCQHFDSVSNLENPETPSESNSTSSMPTCPSPTLAELGLSKIYYDSNTKIFMTIPPDTPPSSSSSTSLSSVGESLSGSSNSVNETNTLKAEDKSSPIVVPKNVNLQMSSLASPPSHSQSLPVVVSESKLIKPGQSNPEEVTKSLDAGLPLFKRGTGKRKVSSYLEEAVGHLKDMSGPIALPPPPVQDSALYLGNLLASRLRELDAEKRRQLENEIMGVMCRYS